MRKPIVLLMASVVTAVAIYYLVARPATPSNSDKEKPLEVRSDSDLFNASYAELMSAYFKVKDALVNGDTVSADAGALALLNAADSVRINDIIGDSSGAIRDLARTFLMEINTAATYFRRAPGISERRKQFEQITELIWNLTRSVRYSGEVVYYQFCPMAFDNKGAYWLSSENIIRNPYFGQEMLTCGKVMDSINYSSPR